MTPLPFSPRRYSAVVASSTTVVFVAIGQIVFAYQNGPYTGGVPWDWRIGDSWQWFLFCATALCNIVATIAAAPAAGALVKRICDASLEGTAPTLTVLVPCYMPNEQVLIMSTIERILTKLQYPRYARATQTYSRHCVAALPSPRAVTSPVTTCVAAGSHSSCATTHRRRCR